MGVGGVRGTAVIDSLPWHHSDPPHVQVRAHERGDIRRGTSIGTRQGLRETCQPLSFMMSEHCRPPLGGLPAGARGCVDAEQRALGDFGQACDERIDIVGCMS